MKDSGGFGAINLLAAIEVVRTLPLYCARTRGRSEGSAPN